MEATPLTPNLFKYLFLGGLYLFLLGLFWALWWAMGELRGRTGAGEKVTAYPTRVPHTRLVVLVESGALSGKQFSLARELTIGRSPGNDVILADRFVSSRHATVRRQADEAWLVDEGSTNGTFLNGFRITRASPMRSGDTFVIGGTTFRLVQE